MPHAALNLRDLNVSGKITLAKRILAAMTDNINFLTPDPPLVLLNRLIKDLEAHQDAKNEMLLDETLGRLANYVQKTSGGSESIIHSAGMEVEQAYGYNTGIAKPKNLTVILGRSASEIQLRCDVVPGAKTYVFQYTTDPLSPASTWLIGSVSTGNSGTIVCSPGLVYWFRVSAVGLSGQGPWSEAVSGKLEQENSPT